MRISVFYISFLFFFQSFSALAQEEENIPYKTETGFGINFNTNGGLLGGVMFTRSVHIKKNRYHLFYFEAVNVKNPKERRYGTDNGNSYIAYKEHYLFSFRPMYGREFLLFRKSEEEGVRVSGLIAVGPSIGLLKPYALQIDYTDYSVPGSDPNNPTNVVNEPYNPENPKHTIGSNTILGTGGIFTAFGQSKVMPGLCAKAGLGFEFGNTLTGVEVGGMVECYHQGKNKESKLIYQDTKNPTVFTSIYINIYFAIRD